MSPADPSLSLAQRIDAVCDLFEADWKAGRRQPIEVYLTDVPGAEREAMRAALLGVREELETRNHSADSSLVEDSQGTLAYEGAANRTDPGRIGRFEILALLGEGAFGKVYKARDPQLDREVAIKVPKLEAFTAKVDLQRFLREAKSAAAVQHPNICPVYEVNVEGKRPYIVMFYIPGKSLAEYLKGRNKPLPPKQVVLIVRKLALALQAAHDKGIVHRDLKPANILLDPQRKEVMITDFGLAVCITGKDRQTHSGMLMGTPAYMSPEQARGEVKHISPRSDIFALGVILYELLTGQRPFQGSIGEVIGQVQHVEPPSIRSLNPKLDERLDAICRQALAKEPMARFASMKAMASALDAYLKDQAGAAATNQPSKEPNFEHSVGLAGVMAALTADRRAEREAVEQALVFRSRPPWGVLVLVAVLIVSGMTALAGIIFYTRTPSAMVMIHIDVDLDDKMLRFFLDGKPVAAKVLQAPIELKVGTHELVVKRAEEVIRKFTFTVSRDAGPRIELREETQKGQPKQPLPAESEDADRRAAKWVLHMGGGLVVQVDGREQSLSASTELPKRPFQITEVALVAKMQSELETGLDQLAGLQALKKLDLMNSKIGDRGINLLKDLPALKHLNLHATQVTDAGMRTIAQLPALEVLGLYYLPLTDAGIAELTRLQQLKELYLPHIRLTDQGLKSLARLKRLEKLSILQTLVTDEGLSELAKLTKLRQFEVSSPNLTGRGVKYLPELETLVLQGTAITDEGLASVRGLTQLVWLQLDQVHQLTDQGLRHLAGRTQLQTLRLSSNRVTSAGLAHLKQLDLPSELRLHCPKVTDEGLRHLDAWWRLRNILDLSGCSISGTGLKHLKMSQLRELHLLGCPVTDEGLESLPNFKSLTGLVLRQSKVTDRGLDTLAKLAGLERLDLSETQVTQEGLGKLRKALPYCLIVPAPPPEKAGDVDRAVAGKVLQLRGIVTLRVGEKEVVVNGRDQHEPFDQLPKEPFQITQIDLRNDKRRALPTDSLEPLAGLRSLKRLTLEGTEIGGNGIRPLRGLITLESLNLSGCKLKDGDLAPLQRLNNLRELFLDWNPLTGTGFVHLRALKKLQRLSLYATATTDDSLAPLYELPELERLVVHQTQVTGKTFPKFITWPRWKVVYLRGGPPSSKELLPHLKTNHALEEIALNTSWTDEDLAHLATNKALQVLEIDDAQSVTNRGLAYLSGLTNLRLLLLRKSQVTDDGLDHLLRLQNLRQFHLPEQITARGVAKLRALKNLRVLGWRSATDAGMVYMKEFPNLGELWLNNSAITDEGLRHLHGLPKLIEIGLKNTKVTTAGIAQLKASYQGRLHVFLD